MPEYDYALAGAYFVTVCTRDHACLFGDVVEGEMRRSGAGRAASMVWDDLPSHYGNVVLDAFVVMPNHVHGIILITDVGAGLKPARTSPIGKKSTTPEVPPRRHGLTEVVRGFKTFSARRINAVLHRTGSVWQRNYYEHVIRSEESLNQIREYIVNNPAQWAFDRENPGSL